MRLSVVPICVAFCVTVLAHGQGQPVRLDKDDVWLLVMNSPALLEAESRNACPEIEFTPVGRDRMQALVRNQCPKKLPASGTMGMYTVDLLDGRIWFDMDETKPIDSERLQRLRTVLLSRQQLRAQCRAER